MRGKHHLFWFKSRIGKIVYRKDTGNHGLKINSLVHAKYLHMVQYDLDLYYSDEPFNN